MSELEQRFSWNGDILRFKEQRNCGWRGWGWRWDEPDWPLRATCPAREPTAVFPARPCAAAAPAPLTCLHPASSLSARLSAHPPVRDRRPPLRGEWFEAAKGIDPGDLASRRSINAQSSPSHASHRDPGRVCPRSGRVPGSWIPRARSAEWISN